MLRLNRIFAPAHPVLRRISGADAVIVLGIAATLWALAKLAAQAPTVIRGPDLSLEPSALPVYAGLSIARMVGAYILSLIFTFVYGYYAASNKRRERVMMPILDILQSIPILAYLPVVVMSLTAILPLGFAKEFSAVLLIFTSQAWNMTFSWYQSLTTIPAELREASRVFQLSPWMRFKSLLLPFGAIGLVWNSLMSWAGGWFALMVSESFSIGEKDYRLPGIGSYIQLAAQRQDTRAITYGVLVLLVVIVGLDQLVWRPLLAYADKFRLDMVSTEAPITSWVYDALMGSRLVRRFRRRIVRPAAERIDNQMKRLFPVRMEFPHPLRPSLVGRFVTGAVGTLIVVGVWEGIRFLGQVSLADWGHIFLGLMVTFIRVMLALAIALAWTIPVGVAIGTNARLARVLQPLSQMAASFPATALYPLFLVGLLHVRGGLELAAMLLMLAGTQWYLLFNVIAGAQAVPQDLKYTAELMGLKGRQKWTTFILPSLFPYIATGAITASGGAWNASILAEYTTFGDTKYSTAYGIGAMIARSQDKNLYPQLMAATFAMVAAVIVVNRLVWKRLYQQAEETYRLD
ncbi:MAG TPA: ABC transporter permease subunit [Fimbriimonadaceae bacterium]|nr:ABC transporter permease subunit [Fimbriimonadaceae bacterium]